MRVYLSGLVDEAILRAKEGAAQVGEAYYLICVGKPGTFYCDGQAYCIGDDWTLTRFESPRVAARVSPDGQVKWSEGHSPGHSPAPAISEQDDDDQDEEDGD